MIENKVSNNVQKAVDGGDVLLVPLGPQQNDLQESQQNDLQGPQQNDLQRLQQNDPQEPQQNDLQGLQQNDPQGPQHQKVLSISQY